MKFKDRVKHYWHLDEGYKFEWNDIRALITIVNVILVISFGLTIAWFGLAVAVLGVVKDCTIDRKISGLVMHLANIGLNIYFLFCLFSTS